MLVSLKYLLWFSSYRADTKLYGKLSKGNNSIDMKASVMVLAHDTSSHHALKVYQVSLKYLSRFSYYRADKICDGQTDRQTDIQTDGRTRKNNMSPNPSGGDILGFAQ